MQICHGYRNVNNQHISAGEIFQGTLEGSAGLVLHIIDFQCRGLCGSKEKIRHTHMHAYIKRCVADTHQQHIEQPNIHREVQS